MRRLMFIFLALFALGAVALPAGAATLAAPVVETGAASGVGTNSATLNGIVNPSGDSTAYWFEYGTSSSYGLQSGTRDAGAGTADRVVNAHIGGLVAGTTYHVRLVAQNSSGTIDGADQTFTTTGATAPVVATGPASGVGAKRALLNGTVNPNGGQTIYWFRYGTSSSYGLQTGTHSAGSGTSGHSVSAGISGLVAGTTYHFQLVAQNSAGVTNGADQTFTTAVAAAPVVQTGPANKIGAKNATLNGTVNPNGGQTVYWFQYGTTTGYSLQTGTRSAGSGTTSRQVSSDISGLQPGVTYHYRVVAQNSSGTTDGQDQTFTTGAAAAPVVQTGSANGVGRDGANVRGTLDANGSQTTYWFQYGTTSAYGQQSASRNGGSGTNERHVLVHLSGLSADTTYHYRLVAQNSAGTTNGADQTFTTRPSNTHPRVRWFAGQVSGVGQTTITLGVLWTGPHDGDLNGQTLTVNVASSTRIEQNVRRRHNPIALATVQPGDLVAMQAMGDSPTALTAVRIHVYCNCHWIGGTITGLGTNTANVRVSNTGPYDTVLKGTTVTLQANQFTVYLRGHRGRRLAFSGLKIGQHVGVVFAADGFFKAPGFNPQTAIFTAKKIHVWGRDPVPAGSSTDDGGASTTP